MISSRLDATPSDPEESDRVEEAERFAEASTLYQQRLFSSESGRRDAYSDDNAG